MRGRAHQLLTAFQTDAELSSRPFMMARLVLMARVIPDQVTPELDDPALEQRLEQAIAQIRASFQRDPEMSDDEHTPSVTPSDLAENLGSYLVVDVRTHAEWDGGHIEGAQHVPLDSLTAEHVADWDRDRTICFVCRVGHRSSIAVLRLQRLGFKRVFNLDGGMLAWGFAGYDKTPATIGRAH